MDREQTITWLTKRWEQQCEQFPLMRRDIPLELYLRANVHHVLGRYPRMVQQ